VSAEMCCWCALCSGGSNGRLAG